MEKFSSPRVPKSSMKYVLPLVFVMGAQVLGILESKAQGRIDPNMTTLVEPLSESELDSVQVTRDIFNKRSALVHMRLIDLNPSETKKLAAWTILPRGRGLFLIELEGDPRFIFRVEKDTYGCRKIYRDGEWFSAPNAEDLEDLESFSLMLSYLWR